MGRTSRSLPLLICVLTTAACSGEGGTNVPIEPPNVAGVWTGTFQLASGTFPATLTISQADRVVGGTAEVVQHLPPSEIIAAIDDFGNVVIVIENGCEEWFGQLVVSDGDRRMEGPLEIDRLQCTEPMGEFGLLVVTR